MHHLTITQARSRATALSEPNETTIITRRGKPVSILMNINTYHTIQALLDLASDPERYNRVMDSRRRIDNGDYSHTKTLEEVVEDLNRRKSELP